MNLKSLFIESDTFTVADIHQEIDTAEDRLFEQAEQIISGLKPTPEMEAEMKAQRLELQGFVGTPLVKKLKKVKEERNEINRQIITTKADAELIRYYKFNYPFQKFLTISELDRICKKYNLIYAPVSNYIKDVPEKNLKEIEDVKTLFKSDSQNNLFLLKVKWFWQSCPLNIRILLRKEVEYRPLSYSYGTPSLSEADVANTLKNLGYKGNYSGYIYSSAIIREVERQGLFICAPRSHFKLSGLFKRGTLGFFNSKTWEVKDPIVFRYCRGGVQVITKWGLEAEDDVLVNEKLN